MAKAKASLRCSFFFLSFFDSRADSRGSGLISVFEAKDPDCSGSPLHSHPAVSLGDHFHAPQGTSGQPEASVDLRCSGAGLHFSFPTGLELRSPEPDSLARLAAGHCLPTAAAALAEGQGFHVQLSERWPLPSGAGCLAAQEPQDSEARALMTQRALKAGGGGNDAGVSGKVKITKKTPPEGPGEEFGAICLSLFMGFFFIIVFGLLIANRLIGHKFVAEEEVKVAPSEPGAEPSTAPD